MPEVIQHERNMHFHVEETVHMMAEPKVQDQKHWPAKVPVVSDSIHGSDDGNIEADVNPKLSAVVPAELEFLSMSALGANMAEQAAGCRNCANCGSRCPASAFTAPQRARKRGVCRWCTRYWHGLDDAAYAQLLTAWRALNA